MLKFSIIIISRNQEELIDRCLNSVLRQTWENVEAIWVDDGSTDGSVAALEARAGSALKLIRNDTARGILSSRLRGLEAATGDYVLFLDGDDELEPYSCEVLAYTLRQKSYDIVGFGTNVVFDRPCPEEFRKSAASCMEPYVGSLNGQDIMDTCFLKRGMSHNVWNKCYSAELARSAARYISREFITLGEDIYFFFIASHLAETFLGIDNRLYVYHHGVGISTSTRLSIDTLRGNMSAAIVHERCREYAKWNGLYEKYSEYLADIEKDFIFGAYNKLRFFKEPELTQAARMLLDTYGAKKVIDTLAGAYWHDAKSVADAVNVSGLFPMTRKKISTVGMYYYRMNNGGVERVMSLLCGILADAGYRVVVITEQEATDEDYPLSAGVKRVVIGGEPKNPEEAAERSRRWAECVKEYELDAVVYHQWTSHSLFWDMCAIKSTGAAFVCHSHNIFMAEIVGGGTSILDARRVLAHADAMLVLSDADRLFWRRFNRNVRVVSNPLTFDAREISPAPLTGHSILWLGRLDDNQQKNAVDALYILKRVLDYVPDATLCMVGGASKAAMKSFRQTIDMLDIGRHISMPGYSSNVADFYRQASVFLLTSSYEGSCMTLSESLAYGVPAVSYELPYMTMAKRSGAVVSVPWKDTTAAADELITLLLEDDRRRELGAEARREALEYAATDYRALWQGIFDSVLNPVPEETGIDAAEFSEYAATVDLALIQACSAVARGVSDEAIIAERRRIYGSYRYRIGKAVLYFPSKLAALLKTIFRGKN